MSKLNLDKTHSKYADQWVAVDWGTSHLRTWLMSDSGEILAAANSMQGMNSLCADQFESTLITLIEPWLSSDSCTVVLACGMLGSRQGWLEVNYLSAPCNASAQPTQAPTQDSRIQVFITPGIKQLSPADVMRGEETQVAGLLAGNSQFSGIVCLPGTHSKWIQVTTGHINHFQTFLTGELYALLSKQSVLRHSVDTDAWNWQAFESAVTQSLSNPASISAKLFSLRANTLVSDLTVDRANALLSGYLIGLELAASKEFWQSDSLQDKPVQLIGDQQLVAIYAKALKLQGIKCQTHTSETMSLEGLLLVYRQLFKAL